MYSIERLCFRWPWVTQTPQTTPIFAFFVAFHIFIPSYHRDFIFGVQLTVASPRRQTRNRPWKGRCYVTWHDINFGCPIHISGMALARALKLCTKGDYIKSGQRGDKTPIKGAWFCSRDTFLPHDAMLTGSPPLGWQMQVGWVKVGHIRRKKHHDSKTIQDRCIVSIKVE